MADYELDSIKHFTNEILSCTRNFVHCTDQIQYKIYKVARIPMVSSTLLLAQNFSLFQQHQLLIDHGSVSKVASFSLSLLPKGQQP